MVPKGQGGDDVIENIVVICGSGTTGCHGVLTEHAPRWQYIAGVLRSHLEAERSECIAYIMTKKGQDWLDKHYPKSPAGSVKFRPEP